jgi:hypothetical protein
VLQITPTARSAAKSVILDVHSRVTQLHDLADQSPDAAVAGDDAEFARFAASLRDTRIDEHHLASTILVPLRTLVLVGGMSGSLDHGADQLYLFVEVAVHEP